MSAGYRDSPGAECPYWEGKDRQSIYCEGVEEGSRIRLSFSSPQDKQDYFRARCCHCKDWHRCRIAQMLDKKWSEYFEQE